jgi:hypothetical protein
MNETPYRNLPDLSLAFLMDKSPLARTMRRNMILSRYDTLPDSSGSFIQPLFIARQRDRQILFVVSGNHEPDPTDPSINMIRRTIDLFGNLTEGQRRTLLGEGGIRVPTSDEDTSIRKDAEAGLVAFKGAVLGIPVDSPEPRNFSESEVLLEEGFTQKQIMYYYFARQIPQWHITRTAHGKGFIPYMNDVLAKYKTYLINLEKERKDGDMRPKWTDFEFSLNHMEEIHNDLFPDNSFDPNDMDFFLNQTATLRLQTTTIQQLARTCNALRCESILSDILKRWNNNESLLVVYGYSHVYALTPLLEILGSESVSDK